MPKITNPIKATNTPLTDKICGNFQRSNARTTDANKYASTTLIKTGKKKWAKNSRNNKKNKTVKNKPTTAGSAKCRRNQLEMEINKGLVVLIKNSLHFF